MMVMMMMMMMIAGVGLLTGCRKVARLFKPGLT